jgi:hypothetical protein
VLAIVNLVEAFRVKQSKLAAPSVDHHHCWPV